MNWTSVKTALPPAGHRVIATDGETTGEAYIVTVGCESTWHRGYKVPWESWARKPVIAWMDMPEVKMRTDPRPLEDFSMWVMLQSGGQKANVPLLRQLIQEWITMATQKDTGQRKNSKGISWDNMERVRMGILCEAVELELSGVLAKLEEEER